MKKFLALVSLFCVFLGVCLSYAAASSQARQTVVLAQDYTVKNFDYLLGKDAGLSDDLLRMHFKLYQGYVTNTNLLLSKIRELDEKNENRTSAYAGFKHMLGWEFNGMLLHEYYFDNLGGTTSLAQTDPLFAKIQTDFGSFENWKADFIATGLMRGIGWVITYQDPKEKRLVNAWINEHDVGHLSGGGSSAGDGRF